MIYGFAVHKNTVRFTSGIILLLTSFCNAQSFTVDVKNTLKFSRKEIVDLDTSHFKGRESEVRIKTENSNSYLPLQWIDNNTDGKPDEVLFQADVPAQGSSKYIVVFDDKIPALGLKDAAYARFVPERSDDFAWENDKVAFRVYGPKGQEEALKNVAGSTLSSGVDIWLKRVAYSIIDKWYGRHVKQPGYYHTDHGEGYDPYHVGNSRGVGGTGVFINDSLQVSQNFTGYKVIASGPLRTVFELEYAPYSDYKVKETKRITLDIGSNFSKFEISLTADEKVKGYAAGISLNENKGNVKINKRKGWVRDWEAIDDSFVGEGIVMDKGAMKITFAKISKTPDQSNLLVVMKPNNTFTFYAGFAWKKSGQVQSSNDWDALLEKQALIIKNPLKVNISKL